MSLLRLCVLAVLLSMATGSYADSGPLFEPHIVYGLPGEAKTAAVGDLNGDGRDDVAVAAWPSALYVLYQQSDGLLGAPVSLYAPWMSLGLALAGINGDGRDDLAVSGSDGVILRSHQSNDGTFGLPGVCYGYGNVNSLVIDDLNGDVLADVADTSGTFPSVLTSLQTSAGVFGLPFSCALSRYNARSICSLDLNSDGIRDLACLVDAPRPTLQAPLLVVSSQACVTRL